MRMLAALEVRSAGGDSGARATPSGLALDHGQLERYPRRVLPRQCGKTTLARQFAATGGSARQPPPGGPVQSPAARLPGGTRATRGRNGAVSGIPYRAAAGYRMGTVRSACEVPVPGLRPSAGFGPAPVETLQRQRSSARAHRPCPSRHRELGRLSETATATCRLERRQPGSATARIPFTARLNE